MVFPGDLFGLWGETLTASGVRSVLSGVYEMVVKVYNTQYSSCSNMSEVITLRNDL